MNIKPADKQVKLIPSEIIFLFPFLFILLAFYIPLINLFASGFSAGRFGDFLTDGYYWNVFLFTVKQSFFSAFFSMVAGLPGAWIMSNFRIPGKKIIKSVTAVPFVLPSILVVLGFVLLFGNNGIINSGAIKLFHLEKPPFQILYSFKAIILAHVFYNCPLFIRIVSSAWEKISQEIIEAAESLGASGRRVFTAAVLPQILPPVIAAFSLVFILCFMSFSIILVLGGGPKYTTLEVEIYRLARINADFSSACSLAVLQSAVTLSFLFFYSAIQKKTSYTFSPSPYLAPVPVFLSHGAQEGGKTRSVTLFQKLMIFIFLLFLFIVIVMPLLMIIIESFKYKVSHAGSSGFSLRWYAKSFSELGLLPVKNSLLIAFLNTLFTVIVSVTALSFLKRKNKIQKAVMETFFVMSMGVSSIILSLSYMKIMSSYKMNIAPLVLLCAAHSTVFLPLVFKSISVFYDRMDRSIIESAESIGAGSWRILFTIELPFIRGGIITGSVLAFALSMGEINSTLMIAPDSFITIPVAIYRLIGAYNFSQACAMGTILILTCIASFLILDRSGSFEL